MHHLLVVHRAGRSRAAPLVALVALAALASTLLCGCVEKTPIERIPESFGRTPPTADEPSGEVQAQGFIGVRVQDNQSDSLEDLAFLPGVRVIEVVESSPGARAGVRVDDVILRIDGEPVNEKGRFDALVRSAPAGRELMLELDRGSRALKVPVVVESSGSTSRAEEVGRVEDLKARVMVRDRVLASD